LRKRDGAPDRKLAKSAYPACKDLPQIFLTSAARRDAERSARVSLARRSGQWAITVFPGESDRAAETWARRAHRNLICFSEVDKGGYFAAWEQPRLFSAELRAAFTALR
jgi:hypothetical protein